MVGLGVLLHAIGGAAAGSFYLPIKKVKEWAWESSWLVNGLFSWIIAPIVAAMITIPMLGTVLGETAGRTLFWTYAFGLLWGIGGLTFGLSVRYLGMSLGYAVVLGFCAAFGTLIPAIYDGRIIELVSTGAGWVVLSGIIVCLIGIALCGYAGHLKERVLSPEEERKEEFNIVRGLLVAGFSGVMSACMAFGFAAGKPIAEAAAQHGAAALSVNNAVLVVVLLGGFTTNALWCLYLNISKGTWRDYKNSKAPLVRNYLLTAAAGVTWYFQFFFYGMGSTQMGEYDFTSWTLHMSFVIVASNVWSLYLREWKGTGRRITGLLIAGIVVIALSTVIIGLGNYLLQGSGGAHG